MLKQKTQCAAFIAGIFSAALSILKAGKITARAFRDRLEKAKIDSNFDEDAVREVREIVKKSNGMGYRDLLKNHTRPAIQKFYDTTREADEGCKDVVLFSVDECHTLHGAKRDTEEDRSTYHALCSVLHDLRGMPIFALFISTTSNTRQLAPPAYRDPSARVHPETPELTQLAPYTAFPFDAYEAIIKENEMTLDEVCRVSFLCKFGRPLYILSHLNRKASMLMLTIS